MYHRLARTWDIRELLLAEGRCSYAVMKLYVPMNDVECYRVLLFEGMFITFLFVSFCDPFTAREHGSKNSRSPFCLGKGGEF